jgi:hypothetical protein
MIKRMLTLSAAPTFFLGAAPSLASDKCKFPPEPPADSLAQTDGRIRGVYATDMKAARGTTAKSGLALKLVRDPSEPGAGGTDRYANAGVATDLAFDAATVDRLVATLASGFAINRLKLDANSLIELWNVKRFPLDASGTLTGGVRTP